MPLALTLTLTLAIVTLPLVTLLLTLILGHDFTNKGQVWFNVSVRVSARLYVYKA